MREHPLREQLWGQLMLALYRCGRQADAVAAYQQVRRVLGTELGIEPGRALGRLQEQILRADAALDLKPAGIRYLELEASLGVAAARPGAPGRSVADAENVLAVAVDIGYRVIEGRALTALAELDTPEVEQVRQLIQRAGGPTVLR